MFSAALNVNLQDENFPAGKFEYVDGFSTVNWPKIPASSNVTHTAVVVPKTVGLFNFTHATVSYLSNDKATKSQVGYSTELGQAYIQSSKEYNRRRTISINNHKHKSLNIMSKTIINKLLTTE